MAKALAMGADAVAIGQGVLIALGCNGETYFQNGAHHSAEADYNALGCASATATTATPASAGRYHHPGRHPGTAPQPAVAANHLKNYLKTLNMELTTIARACGKQNVHHLEPEDLVALTIEAAMAGVPLAGTNWIPGKGF